MNLLPRKLVLAVLVLAGITGESARADITTIAAWNAASQPGVASWGNPAGSTPTYGETFTATGGNTTLTSMTFEIQSVGGASIPFQAYVYAWNGTGITGSALFTSSVQGVPFGSGYQAITVSTGGTLLTAGQQYLAMYSTIGDGGSASSTGEWGGFLPDTTYTGGTFEYNNAASLGALNGNWDLSGNLGDLAFDLAFAPAAVPEPSTWMLLGLGASIGIVSRGLRRRDKPALIA